jgi:deazaflavin-dependent oxidoreductase (nitroreductase family)
VLVLHHVGRRSGKARETPLLYLRDGDDRLVVVASKGGVDQHPAWFHNVMAMDATDVELPGGERRRVVPREATDEERDAYWPRLVRSYPPFESYRGATSRRIPLVVLERARPGT